MKKIQTIILILFIMCNACHSKKQLTNVPETNKPDLTITSTNTPEPIENDLNKKQIFEKKILKGEIQKNMGKFEYSFEQIIDKSTQKIIFGTINPEKRLNEFEQDNGIPITKGSKFFVEEKIDRYACVDNNISVLVRIYEYTGGSQPYRLHKLVNFDTKNKSIVTLVDIYGKNKADLLIKEAEKKFKEKNIRVSPTNFFLYKSNDDKPIIDFYYFPKKQSFQPIKITIDPDRNI